MVNSSEASFLGLAANGIVVDDSLSLHQPVANITSGSQFLIKECFDDYALEDPNFKLVALTKTFSWLIETRFYIPQRRTLDEIRQVYIPKPYPGIELKKRSELNIQPYSNPKAASNYYGALALAIDYAIRTDSLISAAATMQTVAESEKRELYKREQTAITIANAIKSNIVKINNLRTI